MRPTRRSFFRRLLAGLGVLLPSSLSGATVHHRPARQTPEIGPLDHVAIPIRDVEAMVSFYRALGFEVREGDALVTVHFGDQKLNFHRPGVWQNPDFTLRPPAAAPPCGDFCWVWRGSEEALRARLAAAGAEVEAEGERVGGRDGGRARGQSLYLRDPDGNLLEFIRYEG